MHSWNGVVRGAGSRGVTASDVRIGHEFMGGLAERDGSNRRLETWKEIGSFLNRDARTVRRWESERGLPVRRVPGAKSKVYAWSGDLNDWLAGPQAEVAQAEAPEETPRPVWRSPRVFAAGGASLGAFVVAHRTDRAYPDYVDGAKVATLVVNPSLATVAADEVIRALPGVQAVYSDATLLGSITHTEPTPAAELLADETAVIVIEWAERMGRYPLPASTWRITIQGDGEEPRRINVSR